MGLNDKKKVVEMFVNGKETLPTYLAKTTWDLVCECFNYPNECEDYFINEDTVERQVEFEFTYQKEIDGNEIELEAEELLEEVKRYFPSEYDYFKPILTGGVDSKVISMVPKALFKDGNAVWEVKKSALLEDIEKVLKQIAQEEGAEIEMRFIDRTWLFDVRKSNPFGQKVNEPLVSKGGQPSYKFYATVRVKRI